MPFELPPFELPPFAARRPPERALTMPPPFEAPPFEVPPFEAPPFALDVLPAAGAVDPLVVLSPAIRLAPSGCSLVMVLF
ncbi:hypothetical protein GCM10009557_74630 [Virgisporangium ochraceum]|uniref:Uncharacterized protein n=1 Tax=Virgisporangium ochraceum TaxID=65505 RepID=A0A8J3ZUT6_9ACTN|nr:hypothetical protein Voc01_044150 [Virgisporangium ochraceum]